MRLQFYKLRVIAMLYVFKILAKILCIEIPPVLSVAGIIPHGNTLLFLSLSYSKGLGLPGGLVQEGETLEGALRREVFEETGLSISKLTYFCSTASTYHGIPTMAAVFLLETSGDLKESDEGKLIWMDPRDAIGKLFYRDAEETIKKFLKSQD